ncbi:Uncharacterized protein TCM_009376 [Theobroma cacao]|uniref:Uncharacterized protein n=1 Tax=Theobroma cacao TaxID=3641 RepID=A0A061E6N0_THECC|nr:Uncharacterized protein TCM_009376 [Theobroma cacao]
MHHKCEVPHCPDPGTLMDRLRPEIFSFVLQSRLVVFSYIPHHLSVQHFFHNREENVLQRSPPYGVYLPLLLSPYSFLVVPLHFSHSLVESVGLLSRSS